LFSQASHNSRTSAVAPIDGSAEIAARVRELISGLRPDNVDMLAAFHRIQHEYGYIPGEAVPLIAATFDTTPALVFGAIDFYSELRTEAPAEEVVEWCSGPACLLKGSVRIRRAMEAVLGCGMNGATADGKFELRLVQCDGTCHLAPLVRHRGQYVGPLSASSAIEWVRALKGVEPRAAERAPAGADVISEEPGAAVEEGP
jgi:NADH:ubiquinone oxidoreductase subunit E